MHRRHVRQHRTTFGDIFRREDGATIEVVCDEGRAVKHARVTADHHELKLGVSESLQQPVQIVPDVVPRLSAMLARVPMLNPDTAGILPAEVPDCDRLGWYRTPPWQRFRSRDQADSGAETGAYWFMWANRVSLCRIQARHALNASVSAGRSRFFPMKTRVLVRGSLPHSRSNFASKSMCTPWKTRRLFDPVTASTPFIR